AQQLAPIGGDPDWPLRATGQGEAVRMSAPGGLEWRLGPRRDPPSVTRHARPLSAVSRAARGAPRPPHHPPPPAPSPRPPPRPRRPGAREALGGGAGTAPGGQQQPAPPGSPGTLPQPGPAAPQPPRPGAAKQKSRSPKRPAWRSMSWSALPYGGAQTADPG